MKTLRIKVYGRVQGVNFRSLVKKFADETEVKGYVTNKEDGSVEIVAQCSDLQLDKLILWIKSSPGFSKVENVKIEEISKKTNYQDFKMSRIFDS